MDGLFDSYISSNSLALIVSSIIFVVTVTLVAKQLINFVITAVLLFFAVVSGFAIANNDIVRSYFQSGEQSSAKAVAAGEKMEESRLDAIKEHISQIFQQLVETLSNQSKDHQGDKEKSRQLKTSIESVINQLEQQRLQLQEFLDAQSETGLGR